MASRRRKKRTEREIYISLRVAEIEALIQPEDAPPTEFARVALLAAKAKLRLALGPTLPRKDS